MEISVLNASSLRWQMCDKTQFPRRPRCSPNPPAKHIHYVQVVGSTHCVCQTPRHAAAGSRKAAGRELTVVGPRGNLGNALALYDPCQLPFTSLQCSTGSHSPALVRPRIFAHFSHPKLALMWVCKCRIPSHFQWSTKLFFPVILIHFSKQGAIVFLSSFLHLDLLSREPRDVGMTSHKTEGDQHTASTNGEANTRAPSLRWLSAWPGQLSLLYPSLPFPLIAGCCCCFSFFPCKVKKKNKKTTGSGGREKHKLIMYKSFGNKHKTSH